MRSRFLLAALGAALAACHHAPVVAPQPVKKTTATSGAAAVVRDTLLEQRVARLELQLLERDAQLADLQTRLAEARQEVVRTLAKLQTLASRAEAASALAEAEIALQTLRAGQQPGPDVAQATELLQQGTAEFGKQNYGGALYLANQAKSVAGVVQGRLAGPARAVLRPGETPFAVPVPLQAVARGNVRDGPGASFRVLFTVDAGAPLVGYATVEQWVRVADDGGRSGWIHLSLIGRR
jgi:uncharacterized coiled-coil protein SlyX